MKIKRGAGRRFGWKNLVIALLIILVIILIFTFIDFLIHLLKEEYSVPSYYFRNKIIFGTIWGFVVYLFARKLKPIAKSLIFSLAISVVLQIRYYLEGYPKDFVFIFLGIHFVILFVVSYLTFKLIEKFKL